MKSDQTEPWQGRVAMVTGGSGGLGLLIAKRLAALGASVAILGRDTRKLEGAAEMVAGRQARVLPLACDVSDAGAVTEAARRIGEVFGPVDLLVNNAGEGGPVDTVWRVDPTEWWKTFESNLLGSFLCAHAVLPSMIARRRGTIVNIASHAGVYRWPTCSAYSVSKCALIKFTENLAAETRRHGVPVFAFHPGLLSIGLGEASDRTGIDPESPRGKLLAWYRAQADAGRLVDAERSVSALTRVISGSYDRLSGCYVTVDDDLDDMLRRVTMESADPDWYLLRLAVPLDQISITRSDPE